MNWSEHVISVNINLMDGLFIATHVNGCTAYFIFLHFERITSILEYTLDGTVWFISVLQSD